MHQLFNKPIQAGSRAADTKNIQACMKHWKRHDLPEIQAYHQRRYNAQRHNDIEFLASYTGHKQHQKAKGHQCYRAGQAKRTLKDFFCTKKRTSTATAGPTHTKGGQNSEAVSKQIKNASSTLHWQYRWLNRLKVSTKSARSFLLRLFHHCIVSITDCQTISSFLPH